MLIHGKYKVLNKIGQGAYSHVYKARHVEKNYDVAIKCSIKDNDVSTTLIQHEINMYLLLKKAKSTNMIGMKTFGTVDGYIFIIMEYLPYGIEEYMKQINVELQHQLIEQMFSLLSLLHKHHIVHRDIKPDNFMVSTKGKLYIIDLGLSCVYDPCGKPNKSTIGTPLFCSYKIHQSSYHYEQNDDILSLFYVVFYILSDGNLPWKGLYIKDEVKKTEIMALLKQHTHYYEYYKTYNNPCLEKWCQTFDNLSI